MEEGRKNGAVVVVGGRFSRLVTPLWHDELTGRSIKSRPRPERSIMAPSKLGEFELLVLLAILRNADAPYANRLREDLEGNAERRVTRGALYRTLERLTSKGLVAWELEPSEVPERGGHPMRRLEVTPAGVEAVRHARDVLVSYLTDLGPVLDR